MRPYKMNLEFSMYAETPEDFHELILNCLESQQSGRAFVYRCSIENDPCRPVMQKAHEYEELKIGDLVEIVGPSRWDDDSRRGETFQITDSWKKFGSAPEAWSGFHIRQVYPATSLRKLTPEEIQHHLVPAIELSQEALEKILARLSATDKRLDMLGKCQVDQRCGNDEIRNRLAVLEGERPEVIDRLQTDDPIEIIVRRGAEEILYYVLDSMREG